eukprot:Tbor_TRINITY_DN5516_c2_g8::TRINITY_DN5516_c2_g8_i1::g.13405::m.13405
MKNQGIDSKDGASVNTVASAADALLVALRAFDKENDQIMSLNNKVTSMDVEGEEVTPLGLSNSPGSHLEEMLKTLGAALEANRSAGNGDNWEGKPQQHPIWGNDRCCVDTNTEKTPCVISNTSDKSNNEPLVFTGETEPDNCDYRIINAGDAKAVTIDVVRKNGEKLDAPCILPSVINIDQCKQISSSSVIDQEFNSPVHDLSSKFCKGEKEEEDDSNKEDSLSALVSLYCKQLKENCGGVFPERAFDDVGLQGKETSVNFNMFDILGDNNNNNLNSACKKVEGSDAALPSSQYDRMSLAELCEELTEVVLNKGK